MNVGLRVLGNFTILTCTEIRNLCHLGTYRFGWGMISKPQWCGFGQFYKCEPKDRGDFFVKKWVLNFLKMTSFISVCQAWSPCPLFYWITRRFLLESFVCLKMATDSCLWLPFCLFFLQHKTVLWIYQEVNSVSAMASTIKVLQRFNLAQVDTLYQLMGKLFARRTEDGVTQSRIVKVCLSP